MGSVTTAHRSDYHVVVAHLPLDGRGRLGGDALAHSLRSACDRSTAEGTRILPSSARMYQNPHPCRR